MAISLTPQVIIGIMLIGIFSLLFLVLLLVFFGRIIWLQLRIWLLAKRGFVEIDHVQRIMLLILIICVLVMTILSLIRVFICRRRMQ